MMEAASLAQTIDVLDATPAEWRASKRLEEIPRWSLQHRMRGGVPSAIDARRAATRLID